MTNDFHWPLAAPGASYPSSGSSSQFVIVFPEKYSNRDMQLIVANRMIFLSVLRDDSDSARAALERWQWRLPAGSANRPQSSVAYALLFDLLSEVYGGGAGKLQIVHEGSGGPVLAGENGFHRAM